MCVIGWQDVPISVRHSAGEMVSLVEISSPTQPQQGKAETKKDKQQQLKVDRETDWFRSVRAAQPAFLAGPPRAPECMQPL